MKQTKQQNETLARMEAWQKQKRIKRCGTVIKDETIHLMRNCVGWIKTPLVTNLKTKEVVFL